ncbi:hypothetical protein CIK05_12215 [Bdellovibrio sp. qaytius]|nr:hypothetical protein CIK05_12215 [Bdellovibrio sp. qaytius]
MIKIALFSALIAFTQIASASQILSTIIWQHKDGTSTTSVYNGFTEDGFNVANNTCYIESARGVCALIAQAQATVDAEYSGNGAHGTFEVKSCKVEGDTVKLNYDRINDYDHQQHVNISLDIKPCAE